MSAWSIVAESLATRAHEGAFDKAGQPYITNPLRVMALAEQLRSQYAPELDPDLVRSAALLHDVVEDTNVTLTEVAALGAPPQVLTVLFLLSHVKGEPYLEYVGRLSEDLLACIVKLADNLDNSDEARLSQLPLATQERLRAKYAPARRMLQERLL